MENRRPLNYRFDKHPEWGSVKYVPDLNQIFIRFLFRTYDEEQTIIEWFSNAEWKQFITFVHEADKVKFLDQIIKRKQ